MRPDFLYAARLNGFAFLLNTSLDNLKVGVFLGKGPSISFRDGKYSCDILLVVRWSYGGSLEQMEYKVAEQVISNNLRILFGR